MEFELNVVLSQEEYRKFERAQRDYNYQLPIELQTDDDDEIAKRMIMHAVGYSPSNLMEKELNEHYNRR